MSVNTDADEALEAARAHVGEAIDAVAAIVVRECHGSDAFNDRFRRDMRETLNKLMDARDALK